jgi:hypothetical protein
VRVVDDELVEPRCRDVDDLQRLVAVADDAVLALGPPSDRLPPEGGT